ncbi:MAG: TonB-dependent receptor [Planctomycetes bacterium]|nr:TonB-dependent receptor [Planctomycetota bacterium]NUQ35043.1 TonB-dependent receptor [Planctomycetaceae bacterium]
MSILKSLGGAVAIAACVLPCVAQAQEENPTEKPIEKAAERIVITPNRYATPASELGSSLTIIDERDIREKQHTDVVDVLRSAPGIDIARNGGTGAQTSVFLRGANSEHTMLLIDGIEANDPMSPSRSFDFGNLTTDNIGRIEILRGPQSTLYGSDAMGGVINIITKRGKGKPSFLAAIEAGSYETITERASVSGGEDWYDYAASVSRFDMQGFSAADEDFDNIEDDGLQRTSGSVRLGLHPLHNLDVDVTARYIDSKNEIDNEGGPGGDDPNFTSDARQLFLRGQGELSLLQDRWMQRLGVSYTDHERNLRNGFDDDHPADMSVSSFDGDLVKADWQHNVTYGGHIFTLGVEYQEENGRSEFHSESGFGPFTSNFDDKKAKVTGVYGQAHLNPWDKLFTTVGLRMDDHDRFGSHVTWRAAATYEFETKTRLRASVGTGFKAPSLFQLYSSFGNEDLDAEENLAWDIGIEQEFAWRELVLGLTYFDNDYSELITFDNATLAFGNINGATTQGVEFSASAVLMEGLRASLNYTFLDTEDESTGEALLRRAENRVNVNFNYTFMEKCANVNLEVRYTSERDDNDFSTFPATRVELDAHTLVNLAGSYQIADFIRIFGRLENLTDEDYADVFGFATPGLSFYGGLEASF